MTELQLLADFHRDGKRQGPGSAEETRKALSLLDLPPDQPLKIADIGCGTGEQTLTLARELTGHITAVDLFPEFLDELEKRAHTAGLSEQITTSRQSMDQLNFPENTLDLIWSEGAIYIMGFEAGLQAWRPFLKPGGYLVASELTWITPERPREIQDHWDEAYPQVDTIANKINILESAGYQSTAHFILPAYCWTEHYYRPMEERFADFLERHRHSEAARNLVEGEREEIAFYEKYGAYYGYVFYIAKKR